METIIIVIGVVSAILGFVEFVISRIAKGRWWVHGIYVFLVSVFVAIAVHQAGQMARLNSISRAADALVAQRKMGYTHRGYVYAALSFLEKNRDLFPDTYERAKAACNQFRCNDPSSTTNMVELAFALDGLIKGLGTIEGGR